MEQVPSRAVALRLPGVSVRSSVPRRLWEEYPIIAQRWGAMGSVEPGDLEVVLVGAVEHFIQSRGRTVCVIRLHPRMTR